MSIYERTEAFCREYGAEKLEAILEAALEILGRSDREGTVGDITFSHIEQHDVINHTLLGYFQHGEEEICFSIDNGNWNGTVVNEFGEDTDLSPNFERPVYRLKAKDIPYWGPSPGESVEGYAERVATWRKRNEILVEHWRKEPWFQELERSYNYDRHFAPGLKTETYWREKAAKRGLVFALEPSNPGPSDD